ncbi:MAG TPA: DUF305 domain-containing protein [Beijerinckiaceae bacterium]|jgi:uncharacterized protein (DUF305 family)
MHPKSRKFTSHVLLAVALAAGLSIAPLAAAQAQHSGHHEGHAAKPAKKKPPAKKRSSGAHHGPGAVPATPAVAEYQVAHASMMRGMAVPYTGDPDVDFRVQMIPHHQGAIDMARVALRHAKDPWTRQMAEGVIVEQQREIAEMQQWLARRGITPPPGGQPRHVISANSYRTIPEEPGTRAELRGQSWAPGTGLPPASR